MFKFLLVFFSAGTSLAKSLPVDVSILGVRMNRDTLEQASKKFLETAVKNHYGDAGLAEDRVCFSFVDDPNLMFQFAAGSEMSKDIVSLLRVVRTDNPLPYLKCQTVNLSKKKTTELRLPKKVKLGMKKSQVEKKLGKLEPSVAGEGFAFNHIYCSKVRKCSYCRGFSFNFVKDAVSELSFGGVYSDCE